MAVGYMTLSDIKIGESARILSVGGDNALRRHLLDMGLTPGSVATLVKKAPMGDPLEIYIRGYELTIRKDDASRIEVEPAERDAEPRRAGERKKAVSHPHIGEPGEHKRSDKPLIADGVPIVFALAGNQNCGKTTLFNQLTGSNQHVGNFPGVTVDSKSGTIRGHNNVSVVDLPGIYSLSPYTNEEIVTRDFILKGHPDGIINIVDATNIERNLYLTLQLIELNIPIVIALNMMDEVRENGGTIDINAFEDAIGVPVVPISAAKNEGVDELIEHAIHVARFKEGPRRTDFCNSEGNVRDTSVHRSIHAIMHLIEDHADRAGIPVRFAASKLAEGDEPILKALALDDNEKETLDHILLQLQNESGTDTDAALSDTRYKFIEDLCAECVVKPHESKERLRSIKADKILTGTYTAIPAFILIMAAVFYLTFGPVGSTLSDLLSLAIEKITEGVDSALTAYGMNPVVHSLIIDGIFTGVGSVLSFLPVIVVLFFFLSILEDSGYMARVSFVMDKLLRKIGLSGRSFVPMLIGFGCSVPAIMATRTLSSDRDRKMTILLIPFMSCSAKLPIYSLFAYAFFGTYGALVMIGLYIFGIIAGIVFSLILKHTGFKGNPVPFVLELPNYRMPSAKSVGQLIWEKTKDFVTRAFTIIFVASIVIWFLQSFDSRLNPVADSADSMLAALASLISPIFRPLGFGDWRISTALITGFMAKESVVATLSVLLGDSLGALSSFFTPFTALVFLVFTLLYTPCVAAIATVRRELGRRWALGVVILQCVVAWVAAFLVHLIGSMFI